MRCRYNGISVQGMTLKMKNHARCYVDALDMDERSLYLTLSRFESVEQIRGLINVRKKLAPSLVSQPSPKRKRYRKINGVRIANSQVPLRGTLTVGKTKMRTHVVTYILYVNCLKNVAHVCRW